MVATGPTPGSTPIAVPMRAPIKHQKRLTNIGTWTPNIVTHLMVKQADSPSHRSEPSEPKSVLRSECLPYGRRDERREVRPDLDRHSEQPDEYGPGGYHHDQHEHRKLGPPGLRGAERANSHRHDHGGDEAVVIDHETE